MNERIIESVSEILTYVGLGVLAIWLSRKAINFILPRLSSAFRHILLGKTIKIRFFYISKLFLCTILSIISYCCLVMSIYHIISLPLQIKKKINAHALEDAKNPEIICGRGVNYIFGYGVEKNYVTAKKYFDTAAEKNCPAALWWLGFLYYGGLGVNVDINKAITYYEQAAEQNFIKAYAPLGALYIEGKGVNKNIEKGLKYLELAASENCEQSIFLLATLYETGNLIPQNLILAKKYYTCLASRNHHKSQVKLGLLYYKEHNFSEAKKLFEAAAPNEIDATVQLGVMHFLGNGITKNLKKAKELFETAATAEHPNALLYLGSMYYRGDGIPQNYTKAISYWEDAAKQGIDAAKVNLSMLYITGKGVKKNIAKAKSLLSSVDPLNSEARRILKKLNDPEKLTSMTYS